jgi:hypothetical protein
VARKENTPRRKKYRDPETGEWREVEGYRCYCLNPACEWKTFTNYPDEVRLYSSWTFDFLERHYPKLVNAIGNPLIPLTNNTVELVNRRFDQHYQNMCDFDGIETARKYLHLFELTYRFTPFAKDNRPVKKRKLDIHGKCPLELAGYNISQMPIARVVRGQLLGWPPETLQGLVPNA